MDNEAERAPRYRTFGMSLTRERGRPKLALEHFARHTPDMGLMRRFHLEGARLDSAVERMRRLGVTPIQQTDALEEFGTTFCNTPEHAGVAPRDTGCDTYPLYFADFCARMIERDAPAQSRKAAVA